MNEDRPASDPGDLHFRRYRAGDLDALYRLDIECFDPAFRFSRSAMRRFAEANRAHVLIAEAGEALAGFVILHTSAEGGERFGYIVTLDVALSWRRRGVARTLMNAMEREAQADGLQAISLHVFVGNEAAIRFYESLGYARSHRASGFYGQGIDAWLYRKPLDGSSGGGGEWNRFPQR